MVDVPLVERLILNKDEVEATKQKVAFMIQIIKENNLKEEYVSKIYEEWVTVAKRLKKGKEMMDKKEKSHPNPSRIMDEPQFVKLNDLYAFLLAVLSYYDIFFKTTLPEEHHRRLQSAILEILR